MRGRLASLAVAIIVDVASLPAFAGQWLNQPTPGGNNYPLFHPQQP